MNEIAAKFEVIGLIPARWASTRFPGKPLHLIAGKPLVQHVWERCQECSELSEIAIATDDERIAEAARAFGAKVVMTSPDHPSGSDRLAEAVNDFPQATHVINIQGDEPLICPDLIDRLARDLKQDPLLEMATAAVPITDDEDFHNPNVVKVVLNHLGDALYFSRSPIPHERSGGISAQRLRHLGIYAYRSDFLSAFVSWRPSPLEQCEQLEQLRAIENGARIRVILSDEVSIGVDTPEQALEVEQLILSRQQPDHTA